ncbi:esterase/lipase family protein [Subtercola sp. YIM 133946]|uniref:esterase/lipase family protein n=1 Tax=Subtercola sp. YIM 133946 TaxID=3118909 RepID=UPI002F94B773
MNQIPAPVTRRPTARRLARYARWWAADYVYAVYWQVRSLGRSHAGRYQTGHLNPVVVIPGIWETWAFMRPLVERVHAAGHPVFVLTSLGYNSRPVAASAEVVSRFIASNELRDALIVAHSKGGLIGKYAMARLDDSRLISGMVAICTPFSGSRYAPFLLLPALRAFSPRDKTTVMLAQNLAVNSRIVSVYPEFDPHIPGSSELPGARNIQLPTGGHFRILAQPQTLEIVLGRYESAAT